ncbi:MAG TPA: hypothetical protein VFC79_12785, partial [Tissierellaceae bacterium]|nr:hypothetical protein [Tissierellaceae bacterium]
TEMYFKELDLGTGGVYLHEDYWVVGAPFEMKLSGGKLRTKEIKDPSDRFYILIIGNDSNIYVEKDIIGVNLELNGGKIEVGGDIRAITLFTGYEANSQKSTLDVRVMGDVQLLGLGIEGGKLQIDGDLKVGYYEEAYYEKKDWEFDEGFNYIISLHEGKFINTDSELHVDGNISCADLLAILDGAVFANSISMKSDGKIYIDDKVTLFNTIANDEVEAYNLDGYEPMYRMYRTTLKGLLPNQEVDLVMSYDDYDDYTKEFTATADENGNVYVWLVGNQKLSATATYDGEEAQVVTAEASVPSGHVDTLVFPLGSSSDLTPDTDQDDANPPNTSEDADSEGTDPEGTAPEGRDDEATKTEDSGTKKVITNDSEGIPKTGKGLAVEFYSILLVASLIIIMAIAKNEKSIQLERK